MGVIYYPIRPRKEPNTATFCKEVTLEKNAGYEIRGSVLFDNGRGFALGENDRAPAPFVTWQFAEENGHRDYFWGHYHTEEAAAVRALRPGLRIISGATVYRR